MSRKREVSLLKGSSRKDIKITKNYDSSVAEGDSELGAKNLQGMKECDKILLHCYKKWWVVKSNGVRFKVGQF